MKKKEFNWKKFLSAGVIIFIAFIFSLSIFVSYINTGPNVEELGEIATVNGKPVKFHANSPVVREYYALSEKYKNRPKEVLLDRALQNVISGILIEDFSIRNGIMISDDLIDKITADTISLSIANPDVLSSAEIKRIKNDVYSRVLNLYLPQKIYSLIDASAKKTQSKFDFYKDLYDFTVSITAIQIDEIDFIISREVKNNLSSIEDYYLKNYKTLASKFSVKKYYFNNLSEAYKFLTNRDVTPSEISNLVLDKDKNMNIISRLPDDIKTLSKPFYENKKYTVYEVTQVDSFVSLPKNIKDYIALKYVVDNLESLKGKYKPEIEKLVEDIKQSLPKNDSYKLKNLPGIKVVKTDYFSPISDFITSKGEAIDFKNTIYMPEIYIKFFSSEKGKIDTVRLDSSTLLIYKIDDKSFTKSRVSEVFSKVESIYKGLESEIIYYDFYNTLRNNADVKIKDLKKFAEFL